jgi:[acyl-carrier-protein] S-malonyltransferase
MQDAVPAGLGGMSAVIGLDADCVERLCSESSTADSGVWLSNDNCPGQVVISGHLAAIERVTPRLEEAGAKRVMPLRVSAPFHCPLMEPVAERMTADLAQTRFTAPAFPVIANCCAQPYADAPSVPAGLAKQIVAPVQFRTSLAQLPALGVTHLIELGPGNVLTGLARRTLSGVPVHQTGSADKLAAVCGALIGGA